MNRRQRHTLGAIITVVVVVGMFWAFLTAQKRSHYLLRDAAELKESGEIGNDPGVLYLMDVEKKAPSAPAAPPSK
jgi:hypothetical protein